MQSSKHAALSIGENILQILNQHSAEQLFTAFTLLEIVVEAHLTKGIVLTIGVNCGSHLS